MSKKENVKRSLADREVERNEYNFILNTERLIKSELRKQLNKNIKEIEAIKESDKFEKELHSKHNILGAVKDNSNLIEKVLETRKLLKKYKEYRSIK